MIRLRPCSPLLAALLTACAEQSPTSEASPDRTLVAVEVSPANASVNASDSTLFAAVGRLDDGSTTQTAVVWSATGGTVTAGRFRAGAAAGVFRVVASTADGRLADTAQVAVAVPVTLTRVTLTPALDTLSPGGSRTFVATAQFSDGSSSAAVVTWSATGGTVSAGGLYTAGAVSGMFRVIATATSAAHADTSVVVIRDTTTPPSGTVLVTETFEDASVAARGWYDNTNPTVSTAERRSGTGSLQMAWQAGGTVPVNGGALRHLFTPTDRVFLRYWVKYSANFVGSARTYHPHEFEFLTTEDDAWIGPSRTHLGTLIEMHWQNGGFPRVATTDALNIDVANINVDRSNVSEARAVSGCNGNTDGYPTSCYGSGNTWYNGKVWTAAQPALTNAAGPQYKNAWHKVEVYLQLNSIAGGRGQTNGIVQVWVDDVIYLDLNNVLFRTAAHPNMRFNQFLIAAYIGDGSPVAQTMWVDDLVIATARVP